MICRRDSGPDDTCARVCEKRCEYPWPWLFAPRLAVRNSRLVVVAIYKFWGARTCGRPSGALLHVLVGPLRFIHVDVLGVNYVARLVARGAAGGRAACCWPPTCSRAGSRRLFRARRLIRLVQHFSEFVQRTLQVFRRGTQPWHAAFVDSFLRVFDGVLSRLHISFRKLLAIFANHFLALVEDAVEAIARFDFFHAAAVIFAVRFGLHAHLLGFFLGQAAGSSDSDGLLLIGGFVLGAYVENAVGVDVEGDLDLRQSSGRRRNAIQLELAEGAIIVGEFALALQYVNLHAWLVVRCRRISFHLFRRDGGVARDLHGHHAAESFDAQRERGHVQQQDVLDVASQHRALNGRADGHDFVRIDALVRFFATEEVAD